MISADTNIFVYLHDDAEPQKKEVAQEVIHLMSRRRSPIALQVVGELQNVLRRKLKASPAAAAQAGRNLMTLLPVVPATQSAAEQALDFAGTGHISYWDGLLLFTLRQAGVTTLLTEDLQDGERFGAIQIVNPFGPVGMSEKARVVLGADAP